MEFDPVYEYETMTPDKLFQSGWEEAFEENEIETLTNYLSTFAIPVYSDGYRYCIYCGSKLDGMMNALGTGAAFVWGMVHGEANCSSCGAPSRAMHYLTKEDGSELVSIRNFYLEYMPDPEKLKEMEE